MPRSKTVRNSILEILRLCASLWVMYYHGLSLITRTQAFSNGRIAVDFFFILSGFFFLSSYEKENDKTTFKGLMSFIWKRFKPLSITFGICMIFSIIYFIQFYNGFFTSIWGYLWYVPHLMLTFAVYFLLKRLVKNEKLFFAITSIISIICYILILTYTVDYGMFRGIAGVGMGILLSKIPKLVCKKSNLISIITTISIFLSITLIAIFYPQKEFEDPICLLLLFPAIIYFASNIQFSNNIINNICSISFGLYAYQTIIRLLESNNIITIYWQMFLIVFTLACIDILIKKLFVYIKSNKQIKKSEKENL